MSQNSQGFVIVDGSGLALMAQMTSALQALATLSSGATPPNSPLLGQFWLNTAANPYQLNLYDGSQWVATASLDAVNHLAGFPAGATGAGAFAADTSGTANTITASLPQPPASYSKGLRVAIALANSITGAATVSLNGMPAKNLLRSTSQGLQPLAGGEGAAGDVRSMVFDGTQFQLEGRHDLVGEPKPWPLAEAPAGYVLMDGGTASRSGQAALFAALGTTYGAGDGSTTFGLPDYRGRLPIGLDNMGGTDAGRLNDAQSSIAAVRTTLGGTGGAVTHALTVAELAPHAHAVSDPTHGHTIQSIQTATGGAYASLLGSSTGGGPNISSNGAATGISIDNTGSGSTHENVQPGIMQNWIIKA